MHFGCVVAGVQRCRLEARTDHIHRLAAQRRIVRAEAHQHCAADIGRHGGCVEVPVLEHPTEARRGIARFIQLHERHAILRDEHAACGQMRVTVAVEILFEQHLARTDRVGRVDDDHVEVLLRVRDECRTVVDHELQARIVERARRMSGQHFPAARHDLGVDFDHDDACHGFVPRHFAEDAALRSKCVFFCKEIEISFCSLSES